MAIIECSHCKELFNEDEQFCPYCGEEANVRMAPYHERHPKPQKGRRLILGMPLGKWIASLVFLVAALLIILCVYICLTLSGKVKGNDKITNNLNSSVIDSLAVMDDDSSSKLIEEGAFGTISSSKDKNYNILKSTSVGFSALIPAGYKACLDNNELYICKELDENGENTIPYVVISKITEYTDEVECLQDMHQTFAKAYADDNFTLAENLVKYSQGNKTVFEFQFTHTTQGYELLDTRRVINVDGTLYLIASKELADKTIAISQEHIDTLIESFKIN